MHNVSDLSHFFFLLNNSLVDRNCRRITYESGSGSEVNGHGSAFLGDKTCKQSNLKLGVMKIHSSRCPLKYAAVLNMRSLLHTQANEHSKSVTCFL